jgi:site-specific DNA-methyltransferase (adenine-specific)
VRNVLHLGDNLEVLRRRVATGSVDLVYLDPPFNSDEAYAIRDHARPERRIRAFEDSWRWGAATGAAFEAAIAAGPPRAAAALTALRGFLGESNLMAYLAMMAPRLAELRRVLAVGGRIVLHCDPTASHYLKMLMDATFGPSSFRNEIIWERTTPKGLATRRLPTNHDVLLLYARGDGGRWNDDAVFRAYDPADLDPKTRRSYARRDADGRRYQLTSLLNPAADRPNLTYEFLGVTRVWRWTRARMQAAHDAGLIVQRRPGAVPRFKRYLDTQRGRPLGDVWTDIPPVTATSAERLGYPTQKPEALLERLLRMMTDEDSVVLDPFCGCGTTIAVAQRLRRRWIGIDAAELATTMLERRLLADLGARAGVDYESVIA